MTPMLDMVFQLITFFMLVINFKAAALDLSLQLPVIGSARPVDTQGQEDLIVLNIDAEGRERVRQDARLEALRDDEAQSSAADRQEVESQVKPGDELPTTVVIRADRPRHSGCSTRCSRNARSNGFPNFALKAMRQCGGSLTMGRRHRRRKRE